MRKPCRARPDLAGHASAWRSLLAGAAGSVGAMAAHGASGGAVPSLWSLVVLPIAVLLFALLVRRAGDVAALCAASLSVQVAWHLLLVLTPAGSAQAHAVHGAGAGHGADHGEFGMLLAHLAVAALTVLPCLGVERSLTLLADLATAVDEVLAPTVRLLPPAATLAVPATTVAAGSPVGTTAVRLRTKWTTCRHPDRGPPSRRSFLAPAA